MNLQEIIAKVQRIILIGEVEEILEPDEPAEPKKEDTNAKT